MLSLIEETVLPCEERAIEVSRLAPAAVAWLAAQPAGALLLLVPVTAHAEVPLQQVQSLGDRGHRDGQRSGRPRKAAGTGGFDEVLKAAQAIHGAKYEPMVSALENRARIARRCGGP